MKFSRVLSLSALFVMALQASFARAEAGSFGPTKDEFMNEVVGRYGHYDIVAYDAPLPMRTMRSLVITYGFTDFHLEGGELIESETFCHASYKSNMPMVTKVSDAFTRAIVSRSTPVTLVQGDQGWVIFRPETPTLIGVSLPEGEPLPTDPHEVVPQDDDHDGHPGVTVDIKIFGLIPAQMYIARRERFAYELTRREDRALVGVVRDHLEQLILGASHRFLATPNNPHQNPDLSQSPILLVPVSQDYDCERLMQERDQLFPREPRIRG
jgi:hypothetical protein